MLGSFVHIIHLAPLPSQHLHFLDDSAPITNPNEVDGNLILNIDFDQTTTDDLIDKTNLFDITYNQDFQIKLDKDLRVKRFTQDNPDALEQSNTEQAY